MDRRTPLSEEYLRSATVGELQPLPAPICLSDYDPGWPFEFQRHAEIIRNAVGERALRIEHVGSTAVPGLPAKADRRHCSGFGRLGQRSGICSGI